MIEANLTIESQAQSAKAVLNESGQNVNLCYQCRKCAVGCLVSYAMKNTHARPIHGMRLGMDDLVLNSETMWLCASYEMCTTRCQQDFDLAKVTDAVKIAALHQRIKPPVRRSYRLCLKRILDM